MATSLFLTRLLKYDTAAFVFACLFGLIVRNTFGFCDSMNFCPPGYYRRDGQRARIPCPENTYFTGSHSITNLNDCPPCEGGYYCPPGIVSRCPEGFYCPPGSGMIACPAGAQCPYGSDRAHHCPPGTYSHARSTHCLPCQNGTFNGRHFQRKCVPCAKGFYCHEGGTQYRPPGQQCQPGNYCFQGIQRLCPAGTFQPYQEQNTCFPCPKGSYCAGQGQTAITGACTPGWHCGEQSTNQQPTPCRPGHFCPHGYEIPCGLGLFQPLEGQTECAHCPPSFYCNIKASTAVTGPCQTGCCIHGLHTSPNDCDPPNPQCSIRGLVGGTCQPCPVGKYCPYKDIPEGQAPFCEDGYNCDGGATYPNPMAKLCPVGHKCRHH
ncbi:multiple epidermal growth factor-like domains protein 11 [Mya arenaria]|uniref:multiple epidermal growth factor-like domains protein 11 n=1 Tax=Mya arenaria TaxID=6604 RepID=UPI0022E40258|nr:multiple epidermal growth factor-like domains protein 11 [Mya arenaria]